MPLPLSPARHLPVTQGRGCTGALGRGERPHQCQLPPRALLSPPLTFLDLHRALFRFSCFLLPVRAGRGEGKGRSV